MTTSHDFGPQLKAMRERRGITLESISVSTKIGFSLLDGLERSDASHWPKGIFRRAFFRDYAAAIGAPVEDMLAEFLRLFPEDGSAATDDDAATLRMTLATVRSPVRRRVTRIIAGLADAAIVVLLGVAAAWWLAVNHTTGVAAVGLLYYPLTTGLLGRSLAMSWVHESRAANRTWRAAPVRARVEQPAPTIQAVSEPVREEGRPAGFQRDRRTGVDRRRAGRLLHDADTAPITGVFGLRKGSAA